MIKFFISYEKAPLARKFYKDDFKAWGFYEIGISGARSRLILSYVKRRTLNGRVLTMDPSPFLDDIPKDILIPLERRGWKPKKKLHRQLRLF